LSSRSADRLTITVRDTAAGHVAEVTITNGATTVHRVQISADERERFGGGDVTDLLTRSFTFLLAREPNTAILREFDLSTIERYFPDYPEAMKAR
jgi:hypothetical protein